MFKFSTRTVIRLLTVGLLWWVSSHRLLRVATHRLSISWLLHRLLRIAHWLLHLGREAHWLLHLWRVAHRLLRVAHARCHARRNAIAHRRWSCRGVTHRLLIDRLWLLVDWLLVAHSHAHTHRLHRRLLNYNRGLHWLSGRNTNFDSHRVGSPMATYVYSAAVFA
jgi:hypothetical protein